jgi:sulfur relay protein TusB/DsrH
MPTLHTINKAAIDHPANADCLRTLVKGDALVLIEDAVYLSQKKIITRKAVSVFALQHDLATRGLSPAKSSLGIINDGDFVELCTQYEKVVSWF